MSTDGVEIGRCEQPLSPKHFAYFPEFSDMSGVANQAKSGVERSKAPSPVFYEEGSGWGSRSL